MGEGDKEWERDERLSRGCLLPLVLMGLVRRYYFMGNIMKMSSLKISTKLSGNGRGQPPCAASDICRKTLLSIESYPSRTFLNFTSLPINIGTHPTRNKK